MVSNGTLYCLSAAVSLLATLGFLIWEHSPFFWSGLPTPTTCDGQPSEVRVFTQDDLAKYRSSPEGPLLLVVLGDVFDVSEGRRFYTEGEGYHTFIGRDNSRAFSSGAFGEVNDLVLDMGIDEIKTVVGWLEFYKKHKSYKRVGVVEGRYYRCDGGQTAERRAVLSRAKETLEPTDDELLLGRQQFCRISSNGATTTLACHQGRYPRLLRYKSSGRAGGCVCPDASGLEDFQSSTNLALELYPNCPHTESVCVTGAAS